MQRPAFHQLVIADITRETSDCISVAFHVPDNLRQDYLFLPGQHLTLRTSLHGEEVRRSYSICSAPHEQSLRIAIKRVPGGLFSNFANDTLQPGDTLDVMTPSGKFFSPSHLNQPKANIVAFAAGSGITPIIGILKHVLASSPDSTCTLFYANRSPEAIIFLESLEDLKNTYLNRFSLYHILSRTASDSPLFSGRLDADKCTRFSQSLFNPAETSAFYLCGPYAMVDMLRLSLSGNGARPNTIHAELFAAPDDLNRDAAVQHMESPANAQITLVADGRSFSFPMSDPTLSILDAALNAGANLPFACKGGVCCTCKAKLIAGQVSMHRNYGLEPEEIEAGLILTCQAFPTTDTVSIDFDL
jgi:ring-1,2-phenylacetyl-CoA epoxidase subunit PaaE